MQKQTNKQTKPSNPCLFQEMVSHGKPSALTLNNLSSFEMSPKTLFSCILRTITCPFIIIIICLIVVGFVIHWNESAMDLFLRTIKNLPTSKNSSVAEHLTETISVILLSWSVEYIPFSNTFESLLKQNWRKTGTPAVSLQINSLY